MAKQELPILSLKDRARDEAGFARALGESFYAYGFAVVADHGLDADLIARTLAAARGFFALADEDKRRAHVAGGAGQRGYTPFGVEAAKGEALVDLKEFYHVGREGPLPAPLRASMPENVWPGAPPGFRDDVYGLFEAMDALAGEVLSAIARYLGLAPNYFVAPTRYGNSILRLLHYPPVQTDAPNHSLRPLSGRKTAHTFPESGRGMRAAAHEDINAITLLLGAEEAGLQIKTRSGDWLDINPPQDALVINIGDMLQRLTNHVLPSTTHRVINPTPERAGYSRYSIPFFAHFAPDFLIETLASCVSADNPNRYPSPITAQAYLEQRLREIGLM